MCHVCAISARCVHEPPRERIETSLVHNYTTLVQNEKRCRVWGTKTGVDLQFALNPPIDWKVPEDHVEPVLGGFGSEDLHNSVSEETIKHEALFDPKADIFVRRTHAVNLRMVC